MLNNELVFLHASLVATFQASLFPAQLPPPLLSQPSPINCVAIVSYITLLPR